MGYRGKLLIWLGIVILLLLGGIGYTRGWFAIFGAGFDGNRASVSTKGAFDQGAYDNTVYENGALRLQTQTAGGVQ